MQVSSGQQKNVVTKGTMLEKNYRNVTVHGVPLIVTYVHVAVNIAIKGDAFLPRLIGYDFVLVSHVIGSRVAWCHRAFINLVWQPA